MSRITPRKDALASFIWTAGAADMVIGGVGERGSLFTLGLLMVVAGLLVRWLRQQRYGQVTEAFMGMRPGAGHSIVRQMMTASAGLTQVAKRGSAAAAAKLRERFIRSSRYGAMRRGNVRYGNARSGNGERAPRSPFVAQPCRGYSVAARPGLQANRFVRQRAELVNRPLSPSTGSQTQSPSRPRSQSPSQQPSSQSLLAQLNSEPPLRRPVRDSPQGPPLNLPPAPQPRTRRERRVY